MDTYKFAQLKHSLFLLLLILISGCKQHKKEFEAESVISPSQAIQYAKGFSLTQTAEGITLLKISSPWPEADLSFTYALVPKSLAPKTTLNKDLYDAIITIPVKDFVVTSTTHIPAIEALGELDKLSGFPGTEFISSPAARTRIDQGLIKELGSNEAINTELILALKPDVVFGFGIDNSNNAYKTFQKSGVPVVYNGDWTEQTPLGKAEWIKFFAPFFQKEAVADSIFKTIESAYQQTKALAKQVNHRPTVLTGGLYKDVWYISGGKSWMAQFLKDANTNYLWKDTKESGSISMSFESVLTKAQDAEFWINPSLHTSYQQMRTANPHYKEFTAFKEKKIFTNASLKGATGGLIFYELASTRPDIVLRDLIHIFHPELLPEHQPYFFKALE